MIRHLTKLYVHSLALITQPDTTLTSPITQLLHSNCSFVPPLHAAALPTHLYPSVISISAFQNHFVQFQFPQRKMPFFIELSVAFLTLLLATPLPALAINDWSVPCTQEQCSWDPPADFADSGASRSMQIVSVFYLCQAHRCFVPLPDIIYLCIHSGVLSMRFRTLPLQLVGNL